MLISENRVEGFMQKNIIINSKPITIMKPVTVADYQEKTVLTNSSWEYVELWLKRKSSKAAKEALFYWQQAKHFYSASECLPQNSKPLTAYYCCLNATKALLCNNGINVHNISHGITQSRHGNDINNSLDKAEVIFLGGGALTELSRYLGEDVSKQIIVVKDLLYNIPCVHRAFAITYRSPELFIPIKNINFVREDTTSKAWIQFSVDERYANGNALRYLPSGYMQTTIQDDPHYYLRKENNRFKWDIHSDISKRLSNLSAYHKKVRKDLHYIYSDARLWYIKKNIPSNSNIINRNSLTLIFAVMHWMSELVRYNPEKFENYMSTNQNWLLHEFIENALYQFIDEISCEITHQDIMITGYRK